MINGMARTEEMGREFNLISWKERKSSSVKTGNCEKSEFYFLTRLSSWPWLGVRKSVKIVKTSSSSARHSHCQDPTPTTSRVCNIATWNLDSNRGREKSFTIAINWKYSATPERAVPSTQLSWIWICKITVWTSRAEMIMDVGSGSRLPVMNFISIRICFKCCCHGKEV